MNDRDRERLQDQIDQLSKQLNHARAALRRAYEALDWAQEKNRVLERLICRLGDKNGGPHGPQP